MSKVLITDDVHPIMIEEFQSINFEVDYFPSITYDQTEKIIADYSGIIVNTKIRVDKNLIDCGQQLKFIGRVGSGMEHIDITYAKERNIGVFSSPEGNANAVAEHALGMLLCLLNNISKADAEIRNGIWKREENRGVEISGKTIGIIGFGYTGSAFAKKLSGFECNILAFDKYKSGFGNTYVKEVDYNMIIEQSDILSFHLPLNVETKFMMNREMIDLAAKPFYLINTSRGGVIKTSEMIHGLNSGKILGAALDVFENERYYVLNTEEKKVFDTLSSMSNVLMTPHIAGWTFESKVKLTKILMEKIRFFLK
ncbi:MAG: phosphoglycerate dehydrogenase [Bacteroidetes bacterium]|nr:phosphoglycerate dehydrogenase [Bacteroidota bacterium]MBP7398299.1 hydroxyacid dehydrogenase [Chitinophagales bacterium]MBK7108705.1 phosphoglycerate dehydrogenase [Bacteroidota bacterium]MBK8488969.1 phosphoglycerate dehydrogenase [Bacteroidota bacterium]MBP9188647.1 hydroxyacid dehydrogenase [Chitinophagales bacterium]